MTACLVFKMDACLVPSGLTMYRVMVPVGSDLVDVYWLIIV